MSFHLNNLRFLEGLSLRTPIKPRFHTFRSFSIILRGYPNSQSLCSMNSTSMMARCLARRSCLKTPRPFDRCGAPRSELVIVGRGGVGDSHTGYQKVLSPQASDSSLLQPLPDHIHWLPRVRRFCLRCAMNLLYNPSHSTPVTRFNPAPYDSMARQPHSSRPRLKLMLSRFGQLLIKSG